MDTPYSNTFSINASALLGQVASIISYSRADCGLGPVYIAERQQDACGIVTNWVQLADDASVEGCYVAAEARYHDLLDRSLIIFLCWFSAGGVGFYFLQGKGLGLFFGFAWIVALFVLANMSPQLLLDQLHTILEKCAFERHERHPDWNPFLKKGWIRRRRLRRISWVFRNIENSSKRITSAKRPCTPPVSTDHN